MAPKVVDHVGEVPGVTARGVAGRSDVDEGGLHVVGDWKESENEEGRKGGRCTRLRGSPARADLLHDGAAEVVVPGGDALLGQVATNLDGLEEGSDKRSQGDDVKKERTVVMER